jgi:ribonucleoside-diphosphate reductase beta chain
MVIAQEGRLEEEMFLTSFLWEEAKHVEFFSRFFARWRARRPT